MSFLTPWSALVAAAIAVPLLVLLYFLKLRRHALRIPSTLLWRSATEDLQANVPFQRLRWSLLLLLQLLLITVLVAALARPVVQTGRGAASRMILLIDRSASMNAPAGAVTEGETPGPSRLDAATDAARETVDRVVRRSEPAELMVVAFGATPRLFSGFESNRRLLLDAIDAIEPTDEQVPGDPHGLFDQRQWRYQLLHRAQRAPRRGGARGDARRIRSGARSEEITDTILCAGGRLGASPAARGRRRGLCFKGLRGPK